MRTQVIEKAYKKLRLDALVIQQGRLTDNSQAKVRTALCTPGLPVMTLITRPHVRCMSTTCVCISVCVCVFRVCVYVCTGEQGGSDEHGAVRS